MDVHFAAQSYTARAVPLDAQRCVNMFLEKSPADAKTPVPVYGCPGMRTFSNVGTGPIYGTHFMNNLFYVVSGQQLYSIDSTGAASALGYFGISGLVSMADNASQIVAVDGQTGWIYQEGGIGQLTGITALAGATAIALAQFTGAITVGDTVNIPLDNGTTFTTTISGLPGGNVINLAAPLPGQVTVGAFVKDTNVTTGQITDGEFLPAYTVCYFDGYFIFSAVATNEFFLSALLDGTTYSSLDRAKAEANPDYVQAVVNFHEQLLIFGQTSTEFWYNSGAADFPFQRFDGAYLQRGLASPYAVCQEDNTVFWLGDDGIFYRLDKFAPLRVSTFATEHAWAQYGTIADAFVFQYTLEGHKLVVLNFPTAPNGGATWVWDIASAVWHERESWGATNASLGRWRVNTANNVYGLVILGDYATGTLAVADFATFTEYGNTMRGLLTSPPVHKDRKRVFMSKFEIDVESGVGLVVGQGSDPQIMLDWSDDGARTWSTLQKWRSLGKLGAYTQRLRWQRMGQARQRVLRLQITDPVRRVIIGAYLDIKPGM